MTKKCFIVVAPDPAQGVPPNPGGQLTASIGLKRLADEQGFELLYLDTTQSSFPVPSLMNRLLKGIRRFRGFVWLSLTRKPTGAIIFASAGFSYFERALMAAMARVLRVPTILNLRSGHIQRLFDRSGLKQRVARRLLFAPTYLGVQGENWRDFIENVGGPTARTRVIHNWMQPETILPDAPRCYQPSRPVTFCFVGWMVQEKGVREILQAAEKLAAAGKDFRIVMVGGGTLLETLQQQVDAGDLGNQVTFTGWCDHDAVLQTMDLSDVFILPSYAEGFPNALLEAMTLGLPAISTPVGGIPDSLHNGKNGFVIPPRDANALADAMQVYIDTPDYIEEQSRATLEIVRAQHDYRKNCLAMFSVFDHPQTTETHPQN